MWTVELDATIVYVVVVVVRMRLGCAAVVTMGASADQYDSY